MKHLIDVHTTVAFGNELIRVYYSNDLTQSVQNLDEDEFVDIEKHSIRSNLNDIFRQDNRCKDYGLLYKQR